jgi:hypothetical protein
MLPDLLDSLLRPSACRRFAGEPASRAAAYVAFLAILFVGALGVAVKLRLAPVLDETFVWLETSMPSLHIAGGQVTASPPGPLRLEHPRLKEIALMIDTTRKDPVTPQMMTDQKVVGYLTSNALYLQNQGAGRVEVLDLSKPGERPVTLDAESYKEMQRAFDWVFYPSLLLMFFILFSISLAFFALVYALVGLLLSSTAGASLGFGALYRLALHAQTAAALLRCIDTLLPVPIPFLGLATPVVSLVYLWLAVRASAAPSSPPPAPAA